jgi:limonene-1,2-epoxide hydrolase
MMWKQARAVVLFVLLMACAGCRAQPEPSHPLRWARAWIDALNSHDLEQVVPLLAPGASYEDPLSGGECSGPFTTFFLLATFRRFPHAHYELARVTADRDHLAVEWEATGLSKTTSQTPLNGVFVIQLRGNAIASVRGYFNTIGLR